jgi:cytochrome c-type biogenesis protein CcmH
VRRAAATLGLWLAIAPAAIACPQTSLGDIEDEVMCPVCGTSLAIAESAPQAERERAFIQRLIDDCKSKDEVKAALVEEFGDEVLAEPGGDGFELAAYLIPAGVLLAASGAIFVGVRRWRHSTRAAGPGATTAAGSADSKRLDDDLARYDL